MSTTRAVSKSSAAHSPYRRLFMLPGAKAFCLSGAVARLPISMMSLGIVLALNHLYDNWTIAGTMSAARMNMKITRLNGNRMNTRA